MSLDFNYDKITDRLYQGSAPPIGSTLRKLGFDTVVLAAYEYQPTIENFPGVGVIYTQLDDGRLDSNTLKSAQKAARKIVEEHRRGKKILVTCWMGRNRSGLVLAIAIHLLTRMPGRQILQILREKRNEDVLRNPDFENYVKRLGERADRLSA